jgi:hypothetical protein
LSLICFRNETDQGANSQQIVNGTDAQIVVPNGNYSNLCGTNNVVRFTPRSSLASTTIYYECRNHLYMGWKISIVPQTFCRKYSQALGVSQQAFMTTFLNNTGTPLGVMYRLVDPNAPTRPFFDGMIFRICSFPRSLILSFSRSLPSIKVQN